ncbi:Golgi SNAP receptor complex member 1 [Halotydeus destructor]|nr:Golgi SNAP receptor complex member 1 [Halotydeus destructor]
MSETMRQWEDIRKQARQLENEIDSKLLVLSRHGAQDSRAGDDDSDKTPLLSDFSTDLFERISTEIDSLLSKLSDINNKMAQYGDQLTKTPSATYTLQRHRDILTDYTKEFNKTRANILNRREREQLFKPSTEVAVELGINGPNKRSDLYQKEQDHLRNSEQLVDDQINIAIKTRESLINQRTALKAIKTQMTTLANRFPMINTLVNKIGLKKKKDTMILGSVIGVCLFLFILYKW